MLLKMCLHVSLCVYRVTAIGPDSLLRTNKKKKNYSENEIQALLNGVGKKYEEGKKKNIIFASTTAGIHNPEKARAWKVIATEVNECRQLCSKVPIGAIVIL